MASCTLHKNSHLRQAKTEVKKPEVVADIIRPKNVKATLLLSSKIFIAYQKEHQNWSYSNNLNKLANYLFLIYNADYVVRLTSSRVK